MLLSSIRRNCFTCFVRVGEKVVYRGIAYGEWEQFEYFPRDFGLGIFPADELLALRLDDLNQRRNRDKLGSLALTNGQFCFLGVSSGGAEIVRIIAKGAHRTPLANGLNVKRCKGIAVGVRGNGVAFSGQILLYVFRCLPYLLRGVDPDEMMFVDRV